jgi:hypothetical protein
MNTTKTANLTPTEKFLIKGILRSVEDCMSWDDSYGAYTDGGNFIMSLDSEEMKALKNLIKKL